MAARTTTTFVGDHMWFALYPKDMGVELETLGELLTACEKVAERYCEGYIWQQDPLAFELRAGGGVDEEACIVGGLNFGDNVEDEWFATFILREITRQLPLIAKVEDTDGSFLLIEVAQALPRWVEPDTARNRVFLCDGQLHIVPQPSSPADIGVLPQGDASVSQALRAIRCSPKQTCASAQVQSLLQHRLAHYPQHAQESMHHTRCFLPARLLKYLEEHPQTVSSAVSCFYLRDPIDMKRCGKMATFPPSERVMGPVVMSRCMYAQLKQQQFQPPPVFGRMPPPSSSEYNAYTLGAKLACGFEILASKAPVLDLDRLDEDVRFQQFLKGLEHHSYFGANIPGSKAYREKMQAAKQAFLEKVAASQRTRGRTADEIVSTHIQRPGLDDTDVIRAQKRDGSGDGSDGGGVVDEGRQQRNSRPRGDGGAGLALSTVQLEALRLRTQMDAWSSHGDNGGSGDGNSRVQYTPPAHIREDSDEWMTMTPTDLDKLLSAYQLLTTEAKQEERNIGDDGSRGDGDGGEEGMAEAEVQKQLRAMADGISKFVGMESGFEGAVDLNDYFLQEDQDSDDSDDEYGEDGDGGGVVGAWGGNGDEDVQLDAEQFLSGLRTLLQQVADDGGDGDAMTGGDDMKAGVTAAGGRGNRKQKKQHKKQQQDTRRVHFAEDVEAGEAGRREGVGKRGEQRAQGTSARKEKAEGEDGTEDPFADVHDQIERELKGTYVKHGYVKDPLSAADETAPTPHDSESSAERGGDDEASPIALDFNLVHNLLQAYGAQQGVAGPASTLLHTIASTAAAEDDGQGE
ncbi:hypothetical protein PTSG_00916 [Salpingoeca rosetta]|uniref:Uncharacterized protein n=1 Tax=Salpingoeca rosetta (strain ATCC 50818 / BSB-021) TaxID=946362 RepID=F2TXV4_SALR5|nr:uncharacterized protein PTSG_00916 [Salpingoeca rosetta]EGD76213.1 hypothetical protein PTSG_00916 [Salpingoeca rosetta]|eukprot:XP_004998388.1 hypothetical protein PTSG_00916 [Salpingoeca rosetta]